MRIGTKAGLLLQHSVRQSPGWPDTRPNPFALRPVPVSHADLGLQQFGLGLGAAVLIDATVIRVILLPATMKLLGDRNWYLPSWLEWLPHVSVPEEAERVPAFVGSSR